MMTSSRPRGDVGGSFASRRGHAPQLSISDPSHHVTEAIGTLYGDDDDFSGSDGRPTSLASSVYPDEEHEEPQYVEKPVDTRRRGLIRSISDKSYAAPLPFPNGHPPPPKKAQTLPARIVNQRTNSFDQVSPLASPTLSLRDVQAQSTEFPLTNIDNPNDIAQELKNLQSLRRMSMDVGNNSDPDMLPFGGMSLMAMPSIAPKGDDDEGDPSRLLWVPARVHPELAPVEFKSFIENRVQSIKRRSGESFLSAESPTTSTSGSLRRKKSMLSRQIDNSGGRAAMGYVDGADRLERQRSLTGHSTPELSLDELVKDPTGAVQKLAQETMADIGSEGNSDDVPILPMTPGMGLRRSTRTTYRKGGSIRAGNRAPFAKRVAAQQSQDESAESSAQSPIEGPRGYGLVRVQSEPISDNFSRPMRSVRRQHKFSQDSPISPQDSDMSEPQSAVSPASNYQDSIPARSASTSESRSQSVPQIVETLAEDPMDYQNGQPDRPYPQRSSSQKANQQMPAQQDMPPNEPPARSSRRPAPGRPVQSSPQPIQQPQPPAQKQHQQQHQQQNVSQAPPAQTLSDIAAHPSPLPGGGATRTDSLTFIPTFSAEESKKDRKGKKDDDAASVSSTKSGSSWKWFKSGADDKKRKEEEGKKSKARGDGRLDVLQTSIESTMAKGRESLLLDRESIDNKLQEERRKESNRKAETKKEKDGGIFSFFGGGKKKTEKEAGSKKGHLLRPSDDPPWRPLKPDVDYHWTRFPLLEERAIYRLAHIKLANPRRPLLSQVLLSNFMYNYLAIVQAMHPQMQVPQSPQQKRLEEERRRKEQEQQYLAEQQMQQQQQQQAQDSIDRYNFEYHRDASQYGDENQHDGVDYVDDAQIYEYDHGENTDMPRENYDGQDRYGSHADKDYYGYEQENGHRGGRDERHDMW